MSKHDGGTEVETGGAGQAAESARVRQLWHLLEPLHAVLYYAPEVFEEAAALGYVTKERWPSYFPLRAAPLGPVGAEQVASAFYSFSPRMVAEHIDSAWAAAEPGAVLAARLRARSSRSSPSPRSAPRPWNASGAEAGARRNGRPRAGA